MHMFKRYTNQSTKTTQYFWSVEQLNDNVHLANSAQSLGEFFIGGTPQLIVYHPHMTN